MSKAVTGNTRVTLVDVAKRANVSSMSVSNFINGRFDMMAEATQERIASAVVELNYRQDTAARSLRISRTHSVGLIVVDDSPTYLSDGYTTQLVSGLGEALNSSGYTLQIEGLRAAKLSNSRLVRHRQTDGLCVLPSGGKSVRKKIISTVAETGQPFVVLLESLPGVWKDACCVMQTDRKGARELALHVLEQGARQILFMKQTHNQWQAVTERQIGIVEAVVKYAPEADIEIRECGIGDFQQTKIALDRYLESAPIPDAIMCTNDQIGIAVLKRLKALSLAVPDDVMVTGFNAFDFWLFSDPVLTTVRSPGFDLGHKAGTAMIHRLENRNFAQRRHTLETQLQLGETT